MLLFSSYTWNYSTFVLDSDCTMILSQIIGKLLIRSLGQGHILPQIWSEVGISLANGSVCCLGEIAKSASRATGRGVAILNSCHLQQFLGNRSRHDASTSGCRDQTHLDWTTLASHLKSATCFNNIASYGWLMPKMNSALQCCVRASLDEVLLGCTHKKQGILLLYEVGLTLTYRIF